MSTKIRRSWLLVPISKAAHLIQARQAHADVVVLDLVEFVIEEDKPAARSRSVLPLMPYKAAAQRCLPRSIRRYSTPICMPVYGQA